MCRELWPADAMHGAPRDVMQLSPLEPCDTSPGTVPAKAAPGHDVTPAAVRQALDRSAAGDQSDHAASAVAHSGDNHADDSQTVIGMEQTSDSALSMEANALLWALKNLWFGVEDDMTEYAYQVQFSAGSGTELP